MLKPLGRRQARRDTLTAIGDEARELVKRYTIEQVLGVYPDLSRATLYRAINLSIDREAKVRSDALRAISDPLLL